MNSYRVCRQLLIGFILFHGILYLKVLKPDTQIDIKNSSFTEYTRELVEN